MLRGRDVARLLVKFCGLLVVLQALIRLPEAAQGFSFYLRALKRLGGTSTETLMVLAVDYFAQLFIYFIVGIGMIWWARRGVDGSIPTTEESADANNSPKLPEIEAILIAVLGIYFLCDGFTDLIRIAASVSINAIVARIPWAVANWPNLAGYGVGFLKIGIGILLILRREGIVTLRRRIPEWVQNTRRWKPFQDTTSDS
jgi:hypothetical protein